MIESIESPYILAANIDTFKSLVLDNSIKGPVLVNFWSRKAGPCLRQYPILDKLIHHYAGRLMLANIDTENEIILTKEYGVTSVPTMKLFRNGKVIETWHGYQSEKDLTKILDNYVTRDSDQQLAQAIKEYAEGKSTEAYEIIANAIIEDPVNPRLPLAMAKLLKHEERYGEAVKLIETLPNEIRKNAEIVQFQNLLSFFMEISTANDITSLKTQIDASPEDNAAKQELIAHYVVNQQYEQALQELVNIMDTEPNYGDNYAQKAMLRIFNLLGSDHELVTRYKPALRRYTH
jgi:putative thioredoxin